MLLLLLFFFLRHISISLYGHEKGNVAMTFFGDPTPKKVLNAKSGHVVDLSWPVSRLSSGVDPRDPTPKKVLNAKSGHVVDLSWPVSRLS